MFRRLGGCESSFCVEMFVSRLFFFASICLFNLFLACHDSMPPAHVLIMHNFDNSFQQHLFTEGIAKTADSLNIQTAVLYQMDDYPKSVVDSLFKYAIGIGLTAPLQNASLSKYVEKAEKRQTPIIQLDNSESVMNTRRFISSDSYTAGQEAARFIVKEYGENGRFGIFTPTLNNRESTESIRGFRQVLSSFQWKQVNIITCGDDNEQALKQYRYSTRFGNRIIWFIANDCSDFLAELKNLKKDNFFIAIDLHPKENSIKFLQDGVIDAVVTKNFAQMGKLCMIELATDQNDQQSADNELINCGCTVLTAARIAAFDD